MTPTMKRRTTRQWSALLAVGFCGYLTLATSKSVPQTCPPADTTPLEQTFTRAARLSSWRLTATGAVEVTRWNIRVTPAVSLTYVAPKGVDVVIVADPNVEFSTSPGGAGSNNDGDNTSAPTASTDQSSGPLPSDHVLIGDGSLTVVCGSDPSLCEDVEFEVALDDTDATELTLEALALHSDCASSGEFTELRLEPVNP